MFRGRTASAGFRSPEPGWRSRATPVLARWRSRCAERGLRQAGCVAARPAAGCSRLRSFICCRPTSPQVWPGMSSADLEDRRAGTDGIHGIRPLLGIERSKGKRRHPFHGRGRAAKGRSCGFFGLIRFCVFAFRPGSALEGCNQDCRGSAWIGHGSVSEYPRTAAYLQGLTDEETAKHG